MASLGATVFWGWRDDLFASSGALVTICGIFLNIKHTMAFHLKIPLINKYHIKAGSGPMGTKFLTEDMEEWVRSVLADEKYGVAFMIVGTAILAYGTALVQKFSAVI
jgi:hypothetical protein